MVVLMIANITMDRDLKKVEAFQMEGTGPV